MEYNSSNEDDSSEGEEAYFSANRDTESSVASDCASARKAQKRSNLKSIRQNTKSSAKKKVTTETDGFNAFMLALAKDRLADRKKGFSQTACAVELAEQFRRMSDALGSKVKAAYNCAEFVQFLDKSERVELKKYKRDMATADDDDSSSGSE
jgi:hypothetical protein